MTTERRARRSSTPFPATRRQIDNWRALRNIGDFDIAEIDYRLEWALHAIYSDDVLRQRLAWKGGTAINKLFLVDAAQGRLSVDLDFNAVGPKDSVVGGQGRRELRERLTKTLQGIDPESSVTVEKPSWGKDELHWHYRPLSTPDSDTRAFVKLEISTIERFSILGFGEFQLASPEGNTAATNIVAQPLEEQLATKIRAFYDRRKGRDLYDLHRVFQHYSVEYPRLRKMVLYYFYRSSIEFRPKLFFANIDKKLADASYEADVSLYLRTDDAFNWREAADHVRQQLAFLEDLDERDRDFLMLARYLIGKDSMPQQWGVPPAAAHPLQWLFEGLQIHVDARMVTIDDIRIYRRPLPGNVAVLGPAGHV